MDLKGWVIQGGEVFYQGAFRPMTIWGMGERISFVHEVHRHPFTEDERKCERIDATGCYVVPGFIDIHTHGGYGHDLNTSEPEEILEICRFFATQGTTAFLASILTDTQEQTEKAIRAVCTAKKLQEARGEGAIIAGIHLEGPFLSEAYKGAMPSSLLRPADLSLLAHYQEVAENQVRYITVSPEAEGVVEAIPEMKALGMSVAIGHSGADYSTACLAIRKGAAACTHTMNAMRLWHQHEPAIFGAVLESERVSLEIICDGRHLHPASVRLLSKIKGPDRIIAITDSIMAAGLPDGQYHLGVNEVMVEDGDAKLPDGTRAGSTLTMLQALNNLRLYSGWSLEKVLPALTKNPARLTGLWQDMGSIRENALANLLILNRKAELQAVFVRGKQQPLSIC